MIPIIIFPNHSNPSNPLLEAEIKQRFPKHNVTDIDSYDKTNENSVVVLVAPYGQNAEIDINLIPHFIAAVAKIYDSNTIYVMDYDIEQILLNIDRAITSGEGHKSTTIKTIDNLFFPDNDCRKRILDTSLIQIHQETFDEELRIDLTGKSRLILSISKLTLPKGKWTISVLYELDEAATLHRLQFEWGSLQKFETHCPDATGSGRFETKLTCKLDAVQIVELRVALMTPAFSGIISINEVYLERLI